MVLFEMHQSFKCHFLNELRISFDKKTVTPPLLMINDPGFQKRSKTEFVSTQN